MGDFDIGRALASRSPLRARRCLGRARERGPPAHPRLRRSPAGEYATGTRAPAPHGRLGRKRRRSRFGSQDDGEAAAPLAVEVGGTGPLWIAGRLAVAAGGWTAGTRAG